VNILGARSESSQVRSQANPGQSQTAPRASSRCLSCRGKPNGPYDAILSGRGEWGADEVTQMFWIPITVRAFNWKYIGNLGSVRLQLAGIRTQCPLLSS
jgi:hypothetical protein